jgi:hypothetical protein
VFWGGWATEPGAARATRLATRLAAGGRGACSRMRCARRSGRIMIDLLWRELGCGLVTRLVRSRPNCSFLAVFTEPGAQYYIFFILKKLFRVLGWNRSRTRPSLVPLLASEARRCIVHRCMVDGGPSSPPCTHDSGCWVWLCLPGCGCCVTAASGRPRPAACGRHRRPRPFRVRSAGVRL